jgi:hypothetical protein
MSHTRYISGIVAAIRLFLADSVWGKSKPTLLALENGIDEGRTRSEKITLIISSLRVDVHVHGRIADVVMEGTAGRLPRDDVPRRAAASG